MEKVFNKELEKKMRVFLKNYISIYSHARSSIDIPLNTKELEKLIDEIDISLYNDIYTTGTFHVNPVNKFFEVIKNNFDANGTNRNLFLLLHEFTHLSSKFNMDYIKRKSSIVSYFNEFNSIKEDSNISGIDAAFGIIAIEETLAQWCAEKCDSAITGHELKKKKETHSILGNKVTIDTDFSHKDIYAPLETYVEDFAIDLGFKDMHDFAKSLITGEKNLFDMIKEKDAKRLGYLGILCEGIYQENNFQNCGLPATDIPLAQKYLEGLRKNNNFPTDPDDQGDLR